MRTLVSVVVATSVLLAEGEADAPAHVAAAQKLLAARDAEGARAELDKAVELAPKFLGARLARGRLRLALRDAKGALADYDAAAAIDATSALAHVGRGQAHAALGTPEAAIEAYTAAIAIDAAVEQVHFLRGLARREKHDFGGAIEDFDAAVEMFPDGLDAVFARAQTKEMIDDLKGAIEDYDAILSVAAEAGAVYAARGRARSLLGDHEAALSDLGGAAYFLPQDADTFATRGRVRLRAGDEAGALQDLARAVGLDAKSGAAHFSRALLLHDMRRHEESLADFRKALELDAARHEYGRLYIRMLEARLGRGEAGAKELKAHIAAREKKDDWFCRVAGFLSGDLDEAGLLAAAKHEAPYTEREHLCEAYWYAAAMRDIAGDADGAKQLCEKCLATKMRNFIEYDSAAAYGAR